MWNRESRGISLTEVLVASTVLVILSVVFAAIMSQARTSTEGGGKRIEIRAVHREAQKRLTLLLRQAMAPNEVDPAVVSPEYQESAAEVLFHAPEDLIDSALSFDPRTPRYPEFRLRLESGALVIRKSDGTGPKQSIGRGFDSVRFHREQKHSLEIVLSSTLDVRGASAGNKPITETTRNLVRLPGVR